MSPPQLGMALPTSLSPFYVTKPLLPLLIGKLVQVVEEPIMEPSTENYKVMENDENEVMDNKTTNQDALESDSKLKGEKPTTKKSKKEEMSKSEKTDDEIETNNNTGVPKSLVAKESKESDSNEGNANKCDIKEEIEVSESGRSKEDEVKNKGKDDEKITNNKQIGIQENIKEERNNGEIINVNGDWDKVKFNDKEDNKGLDQELVRITAIKSKNENEKDNKDNFQESRKEKETLNEENKNVNEDPTVIFVKENDVNTKVKGENNILDIASSDPDDSIVEEDIQEPIKYESNSSEGQTEKMEKFSIPNIVKMDKHDNLEIKFNTSENENSKETFDKEKNAKIYVKDEYTNSQNANVNLEDSAVNLDKKNKTDSEIQTDDTQNSSIADMEKKDNKDNENTTGQSLENGVANPDILKVMFDGKKITQSNIQGEDESSKDTVDDQKEFKIKLDEKIENDLFILRNSKVSFDENTKQKIQSENTTSENSQTTFDNLKIISDEKKENEKIVNDESNIAEIPIINDEKVDFDEIKVNLQDANGERKQSGNTQIELKENDILEPEESKVSDGGEIHKRNNTSGESINPEILIAINEDSKVTKIEDIKETEKSPEKLKTKLRDDKKNQNQDNIQEITYSGELIEEKGKNLKQINDESETSELIQDDAKCKGNFSEMILENSELSVPITKETKDIYKKQSNLSDTAEDYTEIAMDQLIETVTSEEQDKQKAIQNADKQTTNEIDSNKTKSTIAMQKATGISKDNKKGKQMEDKEAKLKMNARGKKTQTEKDKANKKQAVLNMPEKTHINASTEDDTVIKESVSQKEEKEQESINIKEVNKISNVENIFEVQNIDVKNDIVTVKDDSLSNDLNLSMQDNLKSAIKEIEDVIDKGDIDCQIIKQKTLEIESIGKYEEEDTNSKKNKNHKEEDKHHNTEAGYKKEEDIKNIEQDKNQREKDNNLKEEEQVNSKLSRKGSTKTSRRIDHRLDNKEIGKTFHITMLKDEVAVRKAEERKYQTISENFSFPDRTHTKLTSVLSNITITYQELSSTGPMCGKAGKIKILKQKLANDKFMRNKF